MEREWGRGTKCGAGETESRRVREGVSGGGGALDKETRGEIERGSIEKRGRSEGG